MIIAYSLYIYAWCTLGYILYFHTLSRRIYCLYVVFYALCPIVQMYMYVLPVHYILSSVDHCLNCRCICCLCIPLPYLYLYSICCILCCVYHCLDVFVACVLHCHAQCTVGYMLHVYFHSHLRCVHCLYAGQILCSLDHCLDVCFAYVLHSVLHMYELYAVFCALCTFALDVFTAYMLYSGLRTPSSKCVQCYTLYSSLCVSMTWTCLLPSVYFIPCAPLSRCTYQLYTIFCSHCTSGCMVYFHIPSRCIYCCVPAQYTIAYMYLLPMCYIFMLGLDVLITFMLYHVLCTSLSRCLYWLHAGFHTGFFLGGNCLCNL